MVGDLKTDFPMILQLHLQVEGVPRYELAQASHLGLSAEVWMCIDGHLCPSPPVSPEHLACFSGQPPGGRLCGLMERSHSAEARWAQHSQALRQWPVSPRRSSVPQRFLHPTRQLCAPRNSGFYHGRLSTLAHRSVVRVNQINKLCECRRRCCFAFSVIACQMKYGEFCRCHFIRFRLLLITQNGGKENSEHLHVNQTYACRGVESILFSIAFIDFSWVVFPFSSNVLRYSKCTAFLYITLFPNNIRSQACCSNC